ncbi:hypothetical protein L7F22_036798 [Adiantum nelumboides]|nr:hypothetical protein [Adiantum nelumboides]
MSCPQSLLEQLLSQPHDEALKVLSAWRANYARNKRVLGNPTSNIAYGDPPSVSKYDQKVYEQVFRPPPPMHRDAEKLYGRKFLLRHHPDQYRVLLSNYGEVGKWFANVDSIGDLRNNLEQKNHVLSIIRDKIGILKDIVIDGAFYSWKEEDIYSWCIKSLASKHKYSKKKTDQSISSSSGSMSIIQDLDDEGVGDLHEKVTDLHQDAPLDKTIENAQDDNDLVKVDDMGAIMVHEKEKEEEKSAHEDVEVYIPEIPWENNNDQNYAYEEYQKFIRDESFGVALKVKDSYVIPHDDDHNYVKNKEMKDDISSELCDVNIDLSSRKGARKRKATSKLLELLKKKEKVLRVSKNKNKKVERPQIIMLSRLIHGKPSVPHDIIIAELATPPMLVEALFQTVCFIQRVRQLPPDRLSYRALEASRQLAESEESGSWFWCCFGPDDYRGQVPKPHAKRRATKGKHFVGCQCHFVVSQLYLFPDVAKINYIQYEHIDGSGNICHGDLYDGPMNKLKFAPRLSSQMRDWVCNLLQRGFTPQQILTQHIQRAERCSMEGTLCTTRDL